MHEKGKLAVQKGERKEGKIPKSQQKIEARLKVASDENLKTRPKKIKKEANDSSDFIDPLTPDGQKKILSPKMAKRYIPSVVEKSWYSWWESSGCFKEDSASTKPPFVMVLPPPNVTGALHMAYARTVVIEDAIIRWRRMSGYNVHWIPGLNHNSLTTQVAVEEDRDGKLTRHDNFVSDVRKQKDENDDKISNQLRRLGASLDWSCESGHQAFTMDGQRSEAVTEAFVGLHKEGLISRDCIPVNWDCTICDKDGQEMLESLHNVIHPLEVISGISLEALLKNLEEGNLDPNELNVAKEEKKKDYPDGITECGTDALRFELISSISEAGSINMDIQSVFKYRQWCSRLWNAFHIAIDKLGHNSIPPVKVDVSVMPPICQWVLSALNIAVDKAITFLEAYKLSDAAFVIYSWWQNALRNKFLEAIKVYFSEDSEWHELAKAACRYTLWVCLDTGLRLLHPFMPYVTEELWQRIPHGKDSSREASIMISEYPSVVEGWDNDNLENEMHIVFKVAEKIKSLKPQKAQNQRRRAFALCHGPEITATIARHRHIIPFLSSVSHFKVLRRIDEIPDGCVSAIVNADLSVHLEVKGAINMVIELEKLSKKRDEILKLQDTLKQKMGACGYGENARENIKAEDMRRATILSEKLDSVNDYEMKLNAIGVGESIDPSLFSKISALCKEESWSDMSQPGHAAPLTLDQGALIEERFLAFLRGFKLNKHMFYRQICSATRSMQSKEIRINYDDLQLFDPSLANTVFIFFGSVQKHLVNATKEFLEKEVRSPCENLTFKICDLPSRRFIPLKKFWGSPGNHPSEAADICCGEKSLGITKSTAAGRIVFCNLLRKLFGSFENGNSYNGKWGIDHVMVDPDTYQVEIMIPFCGDCNHWTMHNDLRRCATDIVPEFQCDGHLPAFFGHLKGSLNEFIPERQLNAPTWNKFCRFVTAHLALKPPLVRSNFFDYLHQIYWTLGKGSKKILLDILKSKFQHTKWRDFLLNEMPHPILAVVFGHNKKKKEKIIQERKAGKGGDAAAEVATSDVAAERIIPEGLQEVQVTPGGDTAQGPDLQEVQVTPGGDTAQGPDLQEVQVTPEDSDPAEDLPDTEVFENSPEGLLKLTRHIKQHGSAGSKDAKGEQTLEILSDIDLVISHYLEMLIQILHALIYNIDDFVGVDCSSPDYQKFMVMFEEIFKEYNAPEALPLTNRQDKCETFVFLEHKSIDPDRSSTEGESAKVESHGSSDTSSADGPKVHQGGEHAAA